MCSINIFQSQMKDGMILLHERCRRTDPHNKKYVFIFPKDSVRKAFNSPEPMFMLDSSHFLRNLGRPKPCLVLT